MSPHWVFPADVRGWLSEAEGRQLFELGRGKRVLEIGSYAGRSTICLAQAALEVVSIDWHHGDEGTGPANTLTEFLAGLEHYGVRHRVRVICRRVEDVCHEDLGRFDLAFVDGAHDGPSVERDLNLVRLVVQNAGVICLHDWNYPEVRDAAARVFGLTDVQTVDRMAWFLSKEALL